MNCCADVDVVVDVVVSVVSERAWSPSGRTMKESGLMVGKMERMKGNMTHRMADGDGFKSKGDHPRLDRDGESGSS